MDPMDRPPRLARFPLDRVCGRLYLERGDVHDARFQRSTWERRVLADALGSVAVPPTPGYEVLLALHTQGGADLSALAGLDPSCIEALEVRGSGPSIEPEVFLDAEQMSYLRHLTGLRRLELHDCLLTPGAVTAVAQLPYLCRLTVGGIKGPPDGALAALAALQALEWLEVNLDGVTAAGMAHLATLPRLQSLFLRGIEGPTLSGWAQLPQLTRLRWLDACAVASVTDETLAYVGQLASLEELRITNTFVEGSGLASLSQLPRLRVLRAGMSRVQSRYLAHLRMLPALEEVDLAGTSVTAEGLAHLAVIPRLRRLTFYESLNSSDGLEHLLRAPLLEDLDLTGSDLDDHGLSVLGQHPSLRVLNVSGSDGQTERGLITLARSLTLRELSVGPADIGDAGLAALAGMACLEDLWVEIYGPTGISARGLACLGNTTRLRRLHLSTDHLPAGGLHHLRHLVHLESLGLSGLPRLDASALSFVGTLAHLQTLLLDRNDLGDTALAAIGEMPLLHRLDLEAAGISDAGVPHLARLSALRDLNLAHNRIGAAGLRACLPLRDLEELNLEATDVGDDALPYLEQLPRLDRVVLFDTRITPDRSTWLHQSLPNCDIYG